MAAGKRIIVRCRDEDYARILNSADAMGLTVSDYIRLAESTYARARVEHARPSPREALAGIDRTAEEFGRPEPAEPGGDEPDPAPDDDYEPDSFDEFELADIDIPLPPGASGRGPVRVGRHAEVPPADYDEPPPSALSIRRAPKKSGRDWVTPPDQRDYLSPTPRR